MKITEPNDRPRELIDQLVGVWECSVRVSHGFLSGADVERIKGYVPQAILGVEHLVVAYDAARPLAFLGANGPMLEMLFVDAGLPSMHKPLTKMMLYLGEISSHKYSFYHLNIPLVNTIF